MARACTEDWDALGEDMWVMCFDWDYCPMWLQVCVEWPEYGPTYVRPDADRLAALRMWLVATEVNRVNP